MIQRAGRALGLFSLALGLTQLVAPRRLLGAFGIPPRGTRVLVTRVIGLREIGVGVPLGSTGSAALVAARVAGDVLDLALIGVALRARDTAKRRVKVALATVAGITAIDVGVAVAGAIRSATEVQTVRKAVTIARPVADVYAYWRDLENLPRFMAHLESVSTTEGGRSHWVAKAPIGTVAWDAEIVDEDPERLLAWRSLPGADVENTGTVRFSGAPTGRGTEVLVEMRYRPPAGGIGAAVATLFGESPSQQVADDLRRLKQILEIGEVTRSEATAAGERLRQHPGQPREDAWRLRTPVPIDAEKRESRAGMPANAIVEEVPA